MIRKWRARLRLRLAYAELRDKFADHRRKLTEPYDDQRIIERWQDVLNDIEAEIAGIDDAAEDAEWRRLMALYPQVWHEMGGDDDLGVA